MKCGRNAATHTLNFWRINMVLKAAIRNEHHEAWRAGRLDEIPEHILPLLEEAYGKLSKTEGTKKATKAKENDVTVGEGDTD